MTSGGFEPNEVASIAGRQSVGVAEYRQHEGHAWIGVRLPTATSVVRLTSERVTQQGLSLILFAVLAPILGPRPYELFALVMVFVVFCEAILLDGAFEALVTVDDLEDSHTTAVNLTNGLMVLVFGLASERSRPTLVAQKALVVAGRARASSPQRSNPSRNRSS